MNLVGLSRPNPFVHLQSLHCHIMPNDPLCLEALPTTPRGFACCTPPFPPPCPTRLPRFVLLTVLQPGTDGISIASGATRATLSSTRMQTSFSSAMAPSYAIIARTVAAPAVTRLRILPSSPVTRLSAQPAFGVGIARGRSRICDMHERHRGYSA